MAIGPKIWNGCRGAEMWGFNWCHPFKSECYEAFLEFFGLTGREDETFKLGYSLITENMDSASIFLLYLR